MGDLRDGIRECPQERGEARALTDLEGELLDVLVWMVEHDETNEGDEPMEAHGGRSWDEINAYWIAGLNRAREAIAKVKAVQGSGRSLADATPIITDPATRGEEG